MVRGRQPCYKLLPFRDSLATKQIQRVTDFEKARVSSWSLPTLGGAAITILSRCQRENSRYFLYFTSLCGSKLHPSVVLIDEIDLNLHPPAAQLLIRQLPKLCSTCQFIVTTHSDAVSDVIGEDDTYRLAGGSLCL